MDLEPGRCRRTDGKKWRCYQSVVPNQKYCETHMHRGRKRSRKLVETSIGSAPMNSHNPSSITNTTNKRDIRNNDSKIRNPTILHDKPHLPPSKNPRNSDNSSVKGNNNAGEFKDNVNKGIAVMNQSSKLEFSPDSVLQGALRRQSVEKCKLDQNTESERCRRTDGKKWRCSHKVVPHQKYCANHMNRGAKKPVITLISTPSNAKYAFCSAPGINSSGPERTTLTLGLNTNLNIIPRSSSTAIVNIEDDSMAGSGGSGSTTETTITDESIDVTDMIAISS